MHQVETLEGKETTDMVQNYDNRERDRGKDSNNAFLYFAVGALIIAIAAMGFFYATGDEEVGAEGGYEETSPAAGDEGMGTSQETGSGTGTGTSQPGAAQPPAAE